MQRSLRFQPRKRMIRFSCQLVLLFFIVLNTLCFAGAYRLTHYTSKDRLGLELPRPVSFKLPTDVRLKYDNYRISINATEWLETWLIPVQNSKSKGMVVLFPGNRSSKAIQLLAPAQVFHDLGYDTLLVDFRGVGGSSGNTTTVGMREAKDVAIAVGYIQRLKPSPLILYGVSMGTAAILRAIAQEKVNPDAVILELPFASFLDAVRVRLRLVRIPTFAIAELIVFWGSIQHGFNGFTHNPATYALKVKCPTLILQGKLDKWVTIAEIDQIFKNLGGAKQLVIFPNAGHDLLVTVDREYWKQNIDQFLQGI